MQSYIKYPYLGHYQTVFRSTLMPPDERLMKAYKLDLFMNEFLKIIQL